jgi:hypothetical protein
MGPLFFQQERIFTHLILIDAFSWVGPRGSVLPLKLMNNTRKLMMALP